MTPTEVLEGLDFRVGGYCLSLFPSVPARCNDCVVDDDDRADGHLTRLPGLLGKRQGGIHPSLILAPIDHGGPLSQNGTGWSEKSGGF